MGRLLQCMSPLLALNGPSQCGRHVRSWPEPTCGRRRGVQVMTHLGSGVCIAAAQDDSRIDYSITSSARASTVAGTSRPSALAVLRLNRDLIVTLAARHKLPAVYYTRFFVAGGGLI